MGLMHGAPIWVPEDEASSTRWAGLSFNLNCLDGGLKLAANWADAGPIALPRVDIVFLLRDRIAPRRLLFLRARSAALAGWEDVAPLLGPEEASTSAPRRQPWRPRRACAPGTRWPPRRRPRSPARRRGATASIETRMRFIPEEGELKQAALSTLSPRPNDS